MRATFCALAFGTVFFHTASLHAQYSSDHLTVANTNPRPAPFPDALRVQPLVGLDVWANRMETGPRNSFSRIFNKQHEIRDSYLATNQAYLDAGYRGIRTPTEHEMRYYGNYIVPPRPSVLMQSSSEQQHELRTPTESPFRLRDRP